MHRPLKDHWRTPWLIVLILWAQSAVAQEVTLPLERYDQLRELARPEPEPAPEPPAPVAFEEAVVRIAVAESGAGATSARIIQDLTLTILGDGWQSLAVGDAGTFVDADFGTAEGRLDAASGSSAARGAKIVVRGAGRHRLRLTSVVPLILDETATRPTWRLQLVVPRAALVRGAVEPAPGITEVEAEGAILGAAERDGRRTFVADPGAEVKLALHGATVVPERQSLPLAYEATSALALEVARARRRARSWLEVRVRQGALERLEARVPEGFEVIDVAGDAIAGWDVAGGRLVVTPLAAVTERLALAIELAAGAATELSSPVLVPDGAASVLAATKVHVAGDGLLHLVDAGSGRQPDPRQQAELPAAFRSAPGMALVLPAAGSAARWQVTWADGTEVLAAQVDRLRVGVLAGDAGRAGYQLWAEVRNRGAQRLEIELPAGAELIDARRDGRRIEPGHSTSSAAWTVPLSTGDQRQVIYFSSLLPLALPGAGGRLEVPLPILSAPAGRVEVSVYLPGGRRYELTDAGRAGAAGRLPKPASSEEPFPRPPGFRQVVASWDALSTSPSPLEIRIMGDSDSRRWF